MARLRGENMLIKNDIRRAFMSYRFYVAVAVALTILLRPLAEVLLGGGELPFTYLQQLPFGLSDYTPFAAIFCVLPFADSFCDDYANGYVHAITLRIGPKEYAWQRFVSNALVGGITQGVIVAITLSVCYLGASTPDTLESVAFMQGTPWYELDLLLRFHGALFFTLRVLLAFLFGGLWASVGLCVSAFSTNRYITLVAPFVLYQLLWRLIEIPLFNPVEALGGNSVPSLLLLVLYQLVLITICGVIAVKKIKKGIWL